MSRPPTAPPPAGRLLHRREWLDLGVHSRRLASEEFRRIVPGYLTPSAEPASIGEICRVLQRAVLPDCPVTHTTAALLQGIPLPSQLENGVGLLAAGAFIDASGRRDVPSRLAPGRITDPFAGVEGRQPDFPTIHVSRPVTSSTFRHGVRIHRMLPHRTTTRGGVLVSAPLETLRQLAEPLPLWDLVAAIDAAVGPSGILAAEGLARVRELVDAEGGTCRPGIRHLRRAAALSREDVESVGETHMRLLVMGAGFPEPVPNLVQRISSTGRTRRLDGALPDWGIGLEYDGSWRRAAAGQWREDEARRDDLASEGWELRRFTYRDRIHPLDALLKLGSALEVRGAPVPPVERVRRFVASLDRDRPSMIYGPPRP